MATKTTVELVCDLSGEPADETVKFALDNRVLEVDLTKRHADALREIMADYVGVARDVGKLSVSAAATAGRRASSKGSVRQSFEQNQAIREWARKAGHVVSDRGRIKADIQAKFEEAHRGTHGALAAVG